MTERWDALFVFHADTDPAAIVRICRTRHIQRALFLTTHLVFARERRALTAPLQEAEFRAFAACLDDAQMAGIDDATSTELRARQPVPPPGAFGAAFRDRNRARKNAAVHAAMQRGFVWREAFYQHGLGIDGDYWRNTGARPISLCAEVGRQLRRWLGHTTALLRRVISRIREAKPNLFVIEADDSCYVFLNSIRRLGLSPEVPVRSLRRTSWPRARAQLAAMGTRPIRAAATLHGYPFNSFGAHDRPWVFVDSYLPSNYTRAYLDDYSNAERFVCFDPFSHAWLTRHGFRTCRPPSFIPRASIAEPHGLKNVRTLVCLLNHAGDWSALINRSDTDLLAEAFVQLAKKFPKLQVVIRPHPTAVHPDHEGQCARQRLERLANDCGLPNLSLSAVPLMADLQRGDIFVSEYSQTLIQAWQQGKLGFIANLTGRRSFMLDFERFGFPTATSLSDLTALIAEALRDPENAIGRQASAVREHNASLEAYLQH